MADGTTGRRRWNADSGARELRIDRSRARELLHRQDGQVLPNGHPRQAARLQLFPELLLRILVDLWAEHARLGNEPRDGNPERIRETSERLSADFDPLADDDFLRPALAIVLARVRLRLQLHRGLLKGRLSAVRVLLRSGSRQPVRRDLDQLRARPRLYDVPLLAVDHFGDDAEVRALADRSQSPLVVLSILLRVLPLFGVKQTLRGALDTLLRGGLRAELEPAVLLPLPGRDGIRARQEKATLLGSQLSVESLPVRGLEGGVVPLLQFLADQALVHALDDGPELLLGRVVDFAGRVRGHATAVDLLDVRAGEIRLVLVVEVHDLAVLTPALKDGPDYRVDVALGHAAGQDVLEGDASVVRVVDREAAARQRERAGREPITLERGEAASRARVLAHDNQVSRVLTDEEGDVVELHVHAVARTECLHNAYALPLAYTISRAHDDLSTGRGC